jgi:hypothetical protein
MANRQRYPEQPIGNDTAVAFAGSPQPDVCSREKLTDTLGPFFRNGSNNRYRVRAGVAQTVVKPDIFTTVSNNVALRSATFAQTVGLRVADQ